MMFSQANIEALKEPRGFIKLIEIIIAICAFATAVNNSSYTSFNYECGSGSTMKIQLKFWYPYNLQETSQFTTPLCHNTENNTTTAQMPHSVACYGDYSSYAQFFVFVGVTAFLISLFTVIFYVLADDKFHQIDAIPMADFIITAIYVLLWFISSAAWADGVVKIKHYTDPKDLWLLNNNFPECPDIVQCKSNEDGHFANITVSVIFGFLCMGVWIGNLWFLYKETKWFKDSDGPKLEQTAGSSAVQTPTGSM